MAKICLCAALLGCVITQLCASAADPVKQSVNATTGPAPQSASAPSSEIDAGVRNEVLNELAQALESQYAIPNTAKKLADAVRAKQASNAYEKITVAPELARTLTGDLYAVAHDKHLRVGFSFAPLPQGPPGPPSPEVLNQMRKLNGAISKVEILDGNVGYMRVNGVPPVEAARSAVAAAFAFIHNTDADHRQPRQMAVAIQTQLRFMSVT